MNLKVIGTYMQREHCQDFNQLVGREKPSLIPPTSARSELEDWENNIQQDMLCGEDINLIFAAAFIGPELALLRQSRLEGIFDNLDRVSAIRMGVASVNRGAIITTKQQATKAKEDTKDVTHVDMLTRPKIESLSGKMSVDTAMTSLIDGLPHWLFQASKIPVDIIKPKKEEESDCFDIHRNAALFLSLERSLKDIWQEILWEPWVFDRERLTLSPKDPESAKRWIAWQLREDALLSQAMYFDQAMGYKRSHHKPVLRRTVSKVIRTSKGLRIRTSSPSARQRDHHYWRMEMLERSYLSTFLDLKPEKHTVTMRDLLKAWFVLCDFSIAWSTSVGLAEMETVTDIERLSCEFSSSRWFKILKEGTGLSDLKVSEILDIFTANPLATSETFRSGFWHRPFVSHPSEERLMCLTGVLSCANPIYTMEHWLRDTDMLSGFEKTSLGIKYEADVRKTLSNRLARNVHLTDYTFVDSAIAKSVEDSEEIDLLFRIGQKVLLGEIKCLVRPADPIQRYNHLSKLKDAAEQARRKSVWLSSQPDLLREKFGDEFDLTEHEIVPVVILNTSPGMGVVIDDVICTEKKWLELILGDNSYSSGLIVDNQKKSRETIFTQLYSSQSDFEVKLWSILLQSAGLNKYLNSLVGTTFNIPTSDGNTLVCNHYELDHSAMVTSEMGPV